MAYDEDLSLRARAAMAALTNHDEKKMFGGLCLLVGGHMACGVVRGDLMVRVGAEAHADALARPGARPMDFTGRPMKGMVFVDGARLDNATLANWVRLGFDFASSLPPKSASAKSKARRRPAAPRASKTRAK